MQLEILYRDDRILAVNKPHGMLVHRTRIDAAATEFCVQVLHEQIGQPVFPCHRLDKPTSGVLMFALDKEALSAMNSAFSGRSVGKAYMAIVRGWMEETGTIDKPLPYQPDGGVVRGGGMPQPAVTDFQSVEWYEVPEPFGKFPTSRYSRVELFPRSGRQHQLRRHLKHVFHPVIGDTNYGDGAHNRLFRERYQSHRLLLHATQLQFTHPFSGGLIKIHSPLPADFLIPLPIVKSFNKSR